MALEVVSLELDTVVLEVPVAQVAMLGYVNHLSSRISSYALYQVRTGKTFLPHAVRFGKRYYQRRKYNKGIYGAAGAGAGYYAGSRMHHGYNRQYPYGKEQKISS